MNYDLQEFIRDRDRALRSLDKKQILAYMKKYGLKWQPGNDIVFWAAIHKARLSINTFTDEEKAFSVRWLIEHGFAPSGLRMEEIVEIHKRRMNHAL